MAERIRKAVETSVATTRSTNQVISVTVSIGVASFPRSGETLEQLLHQADTLLYEAKNSDATGSSAIRTDPVLPAPTTACIIFP